MTRSSRAVDRLAGSRGRSAFVRRAIELAVDREERWAAFERSAGALTSPTHDWDGDAADWVRQQRRADVRRAG